MAVHSYSWQIILAGSLSKCTWGQKLWCSSKVEKQLISQVLYILSYYEQLWKHVFILTVCLSFKICNWNEKKKSQGVPFLFSFERICVQGFFTPVDSRAISNAIKIWSRSHWNSQVAFHGLYGAFWWTFSSFGSSQKLYCFHICMTNFGYFEGLVLKLRWDISHSQGLTSLEKLHICTFTKLQLCLLRLKLKLK